MYNANPYRKAGSKAVQAGDFFERERPNTDELLARFSALAALNNAKLAGLPATDEG